MTEAPRRWRTIDKRKRSFEMTHSRTNFPFSEQDCAISEKKSKEEPFVFDRGRLGFSEMTKNEKKSRASE